MVKEMATFFSSITDFFEKVFSIFSTYSILSDTLDLILIAFIVYQAIKLIRDTRALLLAKGLFFLVLVFIIVSLMDMQASTYIFKKVFDNIIVILIIIFHPEIRNALERMGSSSLSNLLIFNGKANDITVIRNERNSKAIADVCKACSDMSDVKIGALIIFEKNTPLGEIISSGTIINADISPELVGNIFYPKAPLHDGAAVIRDGKLYAAGCFLPLTQNKELSNELGTRHRAAIGMSEQSDAMVVVTSEETGAISIAIRGTLLRDISDGALREKLMDYFIVDNTNKKENSFKKFIRGLRNGKK
ncbi:MAG: TIGR00159 family protein [Clostridia bacterium]|nr:TIGR00159 family protein [Clostridia bacterium]